MLRTEIEYANVLAEVNKLVESKAVLLDLAMHWLSSYEISEYSMWILKGASSVTATAARSTVCVQ